MYKSIQSNIYQSEKLFSPMRVVVLLQWFVPGDLHAATSSERDASGKTFWQDLSNPRKHIIQLQLQKLVVVESIL